MQVLRGAIDLHRKGRPNAAKATWKSLPQEFRNRICDLCTAVVEFGNEFPYESITFDSPWGPFKLVKSNTRDDLTLTFKDLSEVVPSLTG